ncbi:hypothetical protein V8G61_14535 [Gaetbulibacter sp. M240]|uniref:hypothetical protein n=1 Tax=Gaetbulibacter sp. M240 TaxID=3126511 RepID=UPI00374EF324
MKTIPITLAFCALSFAFTSCKNDKMKMAQDQVESYVSYVDSVARLDLTDANSNWENIESRSYEHQEIAIANSDMFKEDTTLRTNIEDASMQFETFKKKVVAERNMRATIENTNNLRVALLGKNYVNDDMGFEWINKDNILSVYQNFVNTVVTNKDEYSREDWDEIKLSYEAIDTRKNTVEKEGLTSADNNKIAALKLKFAPMYTFNRMGAKSEENAEAKQ